jgi:hypothetical protein
LELVRAARSNVADILGDKSLFATSTKPQPEVIYEYHDAKGNMVFQKLRYPGKRFSQRRPTDHGKWEYNLLDGPKPLYHLPKLVTASNVVICEGEKDCDNVLAALSTIKIEGSEHLAVTTNFDGAGKWKNEYAPFFAGKSVVIFPDNDEIGRRHAEAVAQSTYPYAAGVKMIQLPGLQEKGDVSDFLQTHTAADLLEEIKKAKAWVLSESSKRLVVPATDFLTSAAEEVDWIVDGVIERGANGFFCADPKSGKSWAAIDLALSLAMGAPWMGFTVPRPMKVLVVSREDNPNLTKWRTRQLLNGKSGAQTLDVENNLFFNTREQSDELMLDNPEQMLELMSTLRNLRPQFVIWDVLNVLHAKEENDNSEMRVVLRQLTHIQNEIGCQMGVVHHFNKGNEGSLTKRMRGSSQSQAGQSGWLESRWWTSLPRPAVWNLSSRPHSRPMPSTTRSNRRAVHLA